MCNNAIITLIFPLFISVISAPDYCTSRNNPEEPNDCVFFSTEDKYCCFNSNSKKCVFSQTKTSEEKDLLCEEDYLYHFTSQKLEYSKYKNEKKYCYFSYNKSNIAFAYQEINYGFERDGFHINETNGLVLTCVNAFYVRLKLIGVLVMALVIL